MAFLHKPQHLAQAILVVAAMIAPATLAGLNDQRRFGGKVATSLTFLPDGRLLVTEKRGRLVLYDPADYSTDKGAIYMDVGMLHPDGINNNAEKGLMGMNFSRFVIARGLFI